MDPRFELGERNLGEGLESQLESRSLRKDESWKEVWGMSILLSQEISFLTQQRS